MLQLALAAKLAGFYHGSYEAHHGPCTVSFDHDAIAVWGEPRFIVVTAHGETLRQVRPTSVSLVAV